MPTEPILQEGPSGPPPQTRRLEYVSIEEARRARGLRLVIVQGLPSPWSQAAKTFFEFKGLSFLIAPYVPFAENPRVVDWANEDSAPIAAWNAEKPAHSWIDILNLAERVKPEPSLLPADIAERRVILNWSADLCGTLGVGWNRRLQMFASAMEDGSATAEVRRLCAKYGYNRQDANSAGERIARSLRGLSAMLTRQAARGRYFFVGDSVSALDIYWVAFMNLIAPLPKAQCPIPDEWRESFVAKDPLVVEALSPALLSHRDRIFAEYWRDPIEF